MHDDVKFESQSAQDLIAYLYLKKKKDGFFIDIGANDGINFSNTYIFEKAGWRGICVEPQPDIFELLQKNRNCDVYNVALYEKNVDSIEFAKVSGRGRLNMFSGLNIEMTKEHKKYIAKRKGDIEYINVKAITFNDLMKNYPDISYIDFMSIDVEGGEMSILNSIDFSKYHFGLITVESHEHAHKLVKYMRRNGYKVFIDTSPGGDVFFIPVEM